MPELYVILKIPFECEPSVRVAPALEFFRWLPSGGENAICYKDENMRISLWFDETSVGEAPKDYSKCPQLRAHNINADAFISDVSQELAAYMQQPGQNEERETSSLQPEYESLGKKILSAVIGRVNRLISFARAMKGQYWLTEFRPDFGMTPSIYCGFNAVAQIDGGKQFRFEPAYLHTMNFELHNGAASITEDEWTQVKAFVSGNSRAPLVGELLSRAEYLIEAGHPRSAITEAHTALEKSVSDFVRHASSTSVFNNTVAERLGIKTLKAQIKHLGFTSSVLYLFPLVISSEILPLEVVDDCGKAIELRNNIVHNGIRNVDNKVAAGAVKAFRKYITILQSLCPERNEE